MVDLRSERKAPSKMCLAQLRIDMIKTTVVYTCVKNAGHQLPHSDGRKIWT